MAQLKYFEDADDFTKITHGILLSEEEQKRRHVIRHLLIRPGLLLSEYQEHFRTNALSDFPVLKEWEEKGYVCQENGYLALTESGLELSDDLGPQLISREIREKMEEWEYLHE